jgi:gliding motility-associated-like protein
MPIRKYFAILIFLITGIFQSFGQLTVSAGDDKSVCPGTGVIIGGSPTASGGLPPYTYSWQPTTALNASNVANPVCSLSTYINYTVTVTDDTGAVSSDVVFVWMEDVGYMSAGRDTSICVNSSASIGSGGNGFSAVTYSWSPGLTLSDSTSGTPIAYPGTTTITYTLTATGNSCPPKTDQVTVTVIPTPLIYAGPDTIIFEGAVAILHGSGGAAYAWGNTPDITYIYSASCDVEPTVTTTYYLFGTEETGKCPGYDQVTVFVEPSDDVVIYNTFTPNGDGNNDSWYIGNIHKYPDNRLEVYNRYGKLVFKSNGYTNNWDGRVSGDELPSGTYFYDLDLGVPGKAKHHGTITIIK